MSVHFQICLSLTSGSHLLRPFITDCFSFACQATVVSTAEWYCPGNLQFTGIGRTVHPSQRKVTEPASSLTLTMLQKKHSLKYYHHHNRKAISFTLCNNNNDSSRSQREPHSIRCTTFYKIENLSLHLLAFRPNLFSISLLTVCTLRVIFHAHTIVK